MPNKNEKNQGELTNDQVRVAIVGIGNRAASLVQGVHTTATPTQRAGSRG